MNSINYFQQIYIINLIHREDRRDEMIVQLKEIGLSFQSSNVKLFPAVRPESAEGFSSIGARGCFLSHLSVLHDAFSNGFERILIFEDDLNFSKNFIKYIDKVIVRLKLEDWSIFYGGYFIINNKLKKNNDLICRASPSDVIQTTHFVGFQNQTIHQMIVFLEDLLSKAPGDKDGGPMHVDGAYNWFRKKYSEKLTIIAVPELGYQRSSKTDIHQLSWFDRLFGVRNIMKWLRIVINKAKIFL